MEGFIILLIVIFLAMPIVALIVAIIATQRAGALETEVKRVQDRLRRLEAPKRESAQTPEAGHIAARGEATQPSPPLIRHQPAPAPQELHDRAEAYAHKVESLRPVQPPAPEPPSLPPIQAHDRPASKSPPRMSAIGLEQKLGAQLPVWIGGIALALAGLFFVRLIAQQGWLTPTVRVLMAGAAGLVMIGLAQWLKRNWAQIAQALAAAGVATWYAATFSAVNVHELLDPRIGFALVGLITTSAVVLSLRHGPFVALLGIIGGFMMPGLLGVENFSPVQLFGYLIVLEVAMIALTRRRNWWPLTLVTMAGAYGWALLWMAFWFDPHYANVIGLFVLASAGAFVAAAWNSRRHLGGMPIMRVMPYLAMIIGLLIAGRLIHVSDFDPSQWIYFGILGIGAMVLGRLRSDYFPMAAAAMVISAGIITLFAENSYHGLMFNGVLLGAGLIYGGGAFIALFGDKHPARWATMSVISTLVFGLIGYHYIAIDMALTALPWWAVAACLGGAYTLGALPILTRRTKMPQGDQTLAVMLIGASVFIALALTLYFETGWLTATLAIETCAIAMVAWKLRVKELRTLVQIGAGAVATRLLLNPAVLDYTLAEHWLVNELWYIYGIPIAALLAAAWISRRDDNAPVSERLGAISAALGLAMIGLLVRHGFHPEHMDRGGWTVYELSTVAIAWGAYGLMMLAVDRTRPTRVLNAGGQIIATIAMAIAVGGSCLALNPLWTRADVGEIRLFNGLLYLYGLPAILAGAMIWLGRFKRHERMAMFGSLAAMALMFTLISLQVRQSFWGVNLMLHNHPPDNAEMYSYSAAWLVFAGTLLAAGVIGGSTMLRYAALAMMLVVVVKVFIIDTRHLQDLWRVLSFLGLGVCLLGLAWVYQRFIFRANQPSEESATV